MTTLTSVLFVAAIAAALTALAARRWRRARLRRAARTRPGSSLERAIAVTSYAAIDEHLAHRWCSMCGGYLERVGEGSRALGGRRYRIVRLVCQECEAAEEMSFDTTDVRH